MNVCLSVYESEISEFLGWECGEKIQENNGKKFAEVFVKNAKITREQKL